MTIQTLQGALQQSIRSALFCNNDFNGDLHALCDWYGVPAGPISGRLIGAARLFDASITDAASALNYFLQNPNRVPSLALDFLASDTLDSRITFTRATSATYFDSAGVLQTAGSGVARARDYNPTTLAPRGFLIEEQRTNSIRNNTMQGAVAGTPGTLPTNWQKGEAAGLTISVVGAGTDNGIAYTDFRLSGTATSTSSSSVQFEQNSAVSASNGQTWSLSSYVQIVGGSTAGLSGFRLAWEERSTVFLAVILGNSFTPQSGGFFAGSRVSLTGTNGNAATTFIKPYLQVTPINGAAIDITLRIGLPQLELGATATSVIPTSGTALTRNADVASMTGTDFSSWYNQAEGSFVAQTTQSGTNLGFAYIASDGTANNRLAQFRNGTTLSSRITVGGAATNPGDVAITAQSLVKCALGSTAASAISAINGTLSSSAAPVSMPVVDQLRIGADQAGSNVLNGHIQRIAYYPVRLANATLQALTT